MLKLLTDPFAIANATTDKDKGDGKSRKQRRDARLLARKGRWSYMGRLSPFWVVYETTLCALMVASAAVYFTYAVQLVDGSAFKSRWGLGKWLNPKGKTSDVN